MTQAQRVLQAFLEAPGRKLTTAQIDKLPYMTGQRQRISDLRKQGHIITATRIKGRNQSLFEYKGQHSMFEHDKDVTKEWYPLPNGWEIYQ